MRKLIILICLLLFVAACSRGTTLTGTTVLDFPLDDSEPVEEGSEEESEERSDEFADVAEPPTVDEAVKGTCTEDLLGTVRVINENGQKEVYRNACLGGILIDYACEGNAMVSSNERCPKGCEVVSYVGQCK